MNKIPCSHFSVFQINIIPVVAVLTKALQEQQLIIEDQNKKIEGLQKENETLKNLKADIEMVKAALKK
jgi:hypothetical protein